MKRFLQTALAFLMIGILALEPIPSAVTSLTVMSPAAAEVSSTSEPEAQKVKEEEKEKEEKKAEEEKEQNTVEEKQEEASPTEDSSEKSDASEEKTESSEQVTEEKTEEPAQTEETAEDVSGQEESAPEEAADGQGAATDQQAQEEPVQSEDASAAGTSDQAAEAAATNAAAAVTGDGTVAEDKAAEGATKPVKEEEADTAKTEDAAAAKTEEAVKMPAKTFTGSANGVTVTVKADEGTFPEGTEIKVKTVSAGSVMDTVEENVDGNINKVKAVDISFWYEGKEIQPEKPVKVMMNASGMDASLDHEILHIDDHKDSVETVVEKSQMPGTKASFEADGFSVYIIVETGENARLEVVFMNGDTEITTIHVKKNDTTSDSMFATVLYDPGVPDSEGLLFRGWTTEKDYTSETGSNTIADVRAAVKEKFNGSVTDGDKMTWYAMLFKVSHISYKDEYDVVIKTDEVLVPVSSSETPSYTVNQPYTPSDPEHMNFAGWEDLDTGTVYQNEDVLSDLSGDINLKASIEKGNWISFRENGGTYTPPEFVPEGQVSKGTARNGNPDVPDPTRHGYTFGGWFTDEACEGEEYAFGEELTAGLTVYAKWTPVENAPYIVMIWLQNTSGDGYDFEEAIPLTGTTGSTINTVTETGSGDDRYASVNGTAKRYTGFHLDTYDTDVKIEPEGTSVVNVMYNRNIMTLNFYRWEQAQAEYTYNEVTGYNGAYGRYYVKEGSGYSNNTVLLYYNAADGKWYTRRTWDWGSRGFVYSGTSYDAAYTRSGGGSGYQWVVYKTVSGLYGSKLADSQFEWPNEYDWYANGNNRGGTSGVHTTFLDAFLPSDGAATTSFYGANPATGSQVLFYKQNATKSGYDLTNTVNTGRGGGSFNISDKYEGFTAAQYRVDNGQWRNVGALNPSTGYYGNAVSYGTRLEIRFNRDEYAINYMDGIYVSGDSGAEQHRLNTQIKEVDGIVSDADLSSYNKGKANYYEPDPEYSGYAFAGWYLDSEGQQEYTFTTMPLGGVTVYAKWVQTQYRVFLHPNADGDESLVYADSGQSTSFRVDNGDQIAQGQQIYMERDEYELVGWYTDAGLSHVFSFETFRANDSTITGSYDKSRSTETDKYGNPTSSTNADKDRFWITHCLELYAKWRSVLPGAKGISVVYDPTADGTGAPTDPNYYTDLAEAKAGAACQYKDDTKVFSHWVLQTWDEDAGAYTDTETKVFPGDDFVVKKSDARTVIEEQDDAGNIIKASYTVQLRAEYAEPDQLTPTHIDWYKNDGTAAFHTDGNKDGGEENRLKINEAVDIQAAPEREGYEFLGWAKVAEPEEIDPSYYTQDLDESNFIYYKDGKFYSDSGFTNEVTQVAADEFTPYEAIFAVWKSTKVPVTVHHYLKGTETKVKDDDTDEIQPGKEYTAEPATTYQGKTLTADSYDPSQTITVKADEENVITVYYTLPLTIEAKTDSKDYDGEPLKGEYTIDGALSADEAAIKEALGEAPSITNVADSPKDYLTKEDQGKITDIPEYYAVTYTAGTLTINPLEVTVTIAGNKKTVPYNGKEQQVEGYEIKSISSDLYSEDSIAVTPGYEAVAKGTDAGTYPMGLKEDVFSNTDDNFKATFKVTDGSLTIVEADIVLTAASDKKVYDGTPLTKAVVESSTLPEGVTVEATTKGSQTNAGESANVVASYKLLDADGKDVTKNFKVETVDGTLTVTPLPITIKANDGTKVYDGTALKADGYEITEGALVEGETEEVTVSGEQTLVGTGAAKVDTVMIKKGDADATKNYEIKKVDGKLTVTDGTQPDDDKPVDDNLVVTKTVNDKEYALGETVEFKVTATNIYDEPQEIKFTEIKGVTLETPVFSGVKPGATVETTASYKIKEEDILAGEFKNTVTAEVGNVKKQAEATARTEAKNPFLSLSKETVGETPEYGYALGETIEYKITVMNGGNLTLTEVVVIDDMTGDEWTIEALAPGESKEFEASYTVTEDDVKKGKVVNVATAKGTSKDPDKPEVPAEDTEVSDPVATTYDITYDLNGGIYDGSTENIVEEHTAGETILIHEAPTREGYEFDYWKGSEFQPGDEYIVTGDHTFVAQWKEAAEEETEDDDDEETPKKKHKSPGTGDSSNILLWIVLLILAAIAAGALWFTKRREDRKQKKD